MGAGNILPGVLDLSLALDQLAVLLLEHVGPLVELLVALEQPPFEVAQLRAFGACFFVGFALQPELLILGLQDDALLLLPGFGDDAAGLRLGSLDRLRRDHRPDHDAENHSAGEGHQGHRHDDGRLHLRPPVRRAGAAGGPLTFRRRGDRGVDKP